MKRFIYIFIIALQGSISFAQTPYDSFAPEISRPMLDVEFIRARDAYHAQQAITTDTLLYIVDMRDGSIIDTISLTDELRKWLSVDPLADKYPNISPYAYAAWNPINKIDPDGREVINEIDETKDPDLYAVANAHHAIDDDNSTITLYAHGSENSIELRDGTTISTAEQFEEYLSNNSTLWNSSENKKNLSIVLMSCNTGNMHAEGSPIAEQISKLLGNIVFAPTTEVATKDGSFYGLYRMEHIDPITHRGTVKPDLDHMGNWQAFTSQGSIELDYRASNLRFGLALLDFLVKICGYEK